MPGRLDFVKADLSEQGEAVAKEGRRWNEELQGETYGEGLMPASRLSRSTSKPLT